MNFRIVGNISEIETIASRTSIRELEKLLKTYGRARWRKRKGIANVELDDGTTHLAEIHWYEAHGIGKRELKDYFSYEK